MSVSGKELHVPVLPLHVPEGPLLGRRHPNGLSRGLGAGRLGRRSRRSVRGLGRRCCDGFFGRHCFGRLRLVCGAGRPASSLRLRRGAPASWARDPEQAPGSEASQAPEQAPGPREALEQGQDLPPHCPSFFLIKILILIIQENRKRNAGSAGIYHISVDVGELKAQGAQGDGAVEFHEMALVRSCLHDIPHAQVYYHFADDVLFQRALDVGGRCEGAASEQQLRVRIHGDEGEDLQGAVDEGGAQQVVDAQGAGGRGARRVAAGAREEASDLVVVEDATVAVVGDSYLIGRFHVTGARVVAADPGGQPRPRVGSDRQHRPVEGLQGLVDPIEVLASVRRQKGVGHTKLEDGELGARLEVEGFLDVKLEGGVVSGDSLAAVHVDSGAHPFLTSPEAAPRRLVGGRAVADLPDPLREGPPGLHDAFGAGAALDVVALTVADRAAPQNLAHHLAQDRPHFRSQSVPPSACRTFRPGASGSG